MFLNYFLSKNQSKYTNLNILQLITLEWKKFRHYAAFKVISLMYILLLPGLMLVGKTIQIPKEFGTTDLFFIFPDIWKYQGYLGNWLSFFFLGFFGILLVTNEYSFKTLRQNIITGMSRKEFFVGKISFIAFVCLVVTLYYTLVSLAFGITHTETIYFTKVVQNIDYIFRYFLMCFSYTIFAFFIGTLTRRTGIALFLYLSYVMFIELFIRYAVHLKALSSPNKTIHFYPMNATEDLVPFNFPMNNFAAGFTEKHNISVFLTSTEAIITTIFYTSIFMFLAYHIYQKRDL